MVMNEIQHELIINWDQTALQLMPTGQWTMHHTGEKVIPIASSDDKRQITAVLAASLIGEYLPPQLIYYGKTERCHPKVPAPEGWDIWHTENHWSNEDTMKWYVEKIVVPFLSQQREALKLAKSHPALTLYDCLRGQTTDEFKSLLEKHNIITVPIPANCTDKLQPMDISINKPMKDALKKKFQSWYAAEIQKQLKEVPVDKVKVDLTAAAIKPKSACWFFSAWHSIEERPEMAINGFRKAGILDALTTVTRTKTLTKSL